MKIFKRIATVLILPLIFIGGINYWVDPDYTLRHDYIIPIATALYEGNLISGPDNINSRLLKKEWLKQLQQSPDMLVLGSSRTLELTKDIFTGKKFINASVSNCTFQDMYAFLQVFEQKDGRLPKNIIICTDQWLFGSTFVENQWLYNNAEFLKMAAKIGIPTDKFPAQWDLKKEWIKELFSTRYLIRSLRFRNHPINFELGQAIDMNQTILLPDGSRIIPERVRNLSENDVLVKANDYFYSSKDEYFTDLDSVQCHLFSGMVRYLKGRNCKIVLFIPPYHPQAFQLLEKSGKTKGVFRAEDYLIRFALDNDLEIIGATNPATLAMSALDFYDAVHLKPESLNRLFKNKGIK